MFKQPSGPPGSQNVRNVKLKNGVLTHEHQLSPLKECEISVDGSSVN